MSSGLAAPIIIPFTTAAIMLLGRRQLNFQHVSSMLAAVLHLATGAWLLYAVNQSGIQVLHVASWPAPFGIALVADHLSALMVVITGIIYTAVSVYSRADITADHRERGYYPLMHISGGGHQWRFSDRRPVQHVCLVRSHADGIVCPAGVGKDPRTT
jgi:multicomponent Na+:H+ antiporter subunit D